MSHTHKQQARDTVVWFYNAEKHVNADDAGEMCAALEKWTNGYGWAVKGGERQYVSINSDRKWTARKRVSTRNTGCLPDAIK